jgi:O-antigen/teichoic acid export membrane protein
MTRLRLNVLANFSGQAWSAVMGLIFVPIYIQLMGVEAYGLVGLYASLQGIIQILDLGLSPTMNREMARHSVQPERADDARDFVRTLEIGYWVIGVVIATALMLAAPVLATQWIRSEQLSADVVTRTIISMSVMTALQWPLSFYSGGLLGLQKQVLLNGMNIFFSTLSNVGSVLILILVSSTITAFFQWQIVVSVLRVTALTVALWWNLPKSSRPPRLRPHLVRDVWRFAAGMSGLSVFSIILTQSDKIILSRIVGLGAVGYYALAGVVASGVVVAVSPVFNALFPRFSALVATGQMDTLQQQYHRGSQVMAIFVVPLTMVLATFSYSVLLVWTGNVDTARVVAPIATFLAIGTGLNGLTHPAYALQLAHGTTKTNLIISGVAVVFLVPMLVVMASAYGAVGAALVWVIFNASNILLLVPITHHMYMTGQTRQWFVTDLGLPTLAALVCIVPAKLLMPLADSRLMLGMQLLAVLAVTFVGSSLMVQSVQFWLRARLIQIWLSVARQPDK